MGKGSGRRRGVVDRLHGHPTVAAVAQRWLQLYVVTARSAKNVHMAGQRVRDFLQPFMGERPIGELRPDDFRRYRIWLQNGGLAPRTVHHLLGDARCLMGWAVEAGVLNQSPFPRRVMPRLQESPPDRLSDHEVQAVLGIGDPQSFVIRLGLGTGLRWAEMCRAHPEHLVGGMLVVAQTKSSRIRRVPLAPALAAEIRSRCGRLVPYTEGSAGSFNKLVRRRSEVSGFHVHQLRHTFACGWIERGGSLPALQQSLGHASIVTTQMYARLSDEHVRREAERVHGIVREREVSYSN